MVSFILLSKIIIRGFFNDYYLFTFRPKQSYSNSPKLPTLLYYDKDMKYKGKFGEEANIMYMKGNYDGVLLKHFKLLLSHAHDLEETERPWANKKNFEVVDAVADFLRAFTKEGVERMAKTVGEVDPKRLGFVITLPPAWSHEAKNTMKEAVKRANLGSRDDQQNLMFITETEAAAIYCEKYFGEQFRMEKHQRFMICDAGGGTVDLATYEVTLHEKLGDELVLKELTSSDCESTGSSYLDEKFRKYLVKKLKEISVVDYNDSGIDEIVSEFSKETKVK
jgi:molecular chaperone DnaK (HSP70)